MHAMALTSIEWASNLIWPRGQAEPCRKLMPRGYLQPRGTPPPPESEAAPMLASEAAFQQGTACGEWRRQRRGLKPIGRSGSSGGGGGGGGWHSRAEGPQELEKAERGERNALHARWESQRRTRNRLPVLSRQDLDSGQSLFSPFCGAKGELS
jgi:hypothetical protein